MDRRISFLKKIVTDGDSNEDYTGGWEKIASVPDVWAYKQDLRGKEVVVADKVQYMYLTRNSLNISNIDYFIFLEYFDCNL